MSAPAAWVDEPHDTGYPLLDAACDAFGLLYWRVQDVQARLEKSHPAHEILSWLLDDLPSAYDRLWQGRGWRLIHHVEVLNDGLNVWSLPTDERLTEEMVAELAQATRVATAKLRACCGYGRMTIYSKPAGNAVREAPCTGAAPGEWPEGQWEREPLNVRKQLPAGTPM